MTGGSGRSALPVLVRRRPAAYPGPVRASQLHLADEGSRHLGEREDATEVLPMDVSEVQSGTQPADSDQTPSEKSEGDTRRGKQVRSGRKAFNAAAKKPPLRL